MKRLETMGERLTAGGGATRGFDYLRLILAASVIVWHSLETSYGPSVPVGVWHHARSVIGAILPMFFALSGFLVCGSLTRTSSIVVFMAHRFLRLIPALLVEILLSALILGALAHKLATRLVLHGSGLLPLLPERRRRYSLPPAGGFQGQPDLGHRQPVPLDDPVRARVLYRSRRASPCWAW